ncbi:MAG: hypothetical protein HFH35_01670 [Eubacterium sp.]|nr:hypothetical protein [Eubacterium sp.]
MNSIKKRLQNVSLIILLCMVCLFGFLVSRTDVRAAGKKIQASISANRVKIGKTVQITSKTQKVSYRCDDTSIVSVSPDGRVTGKKKGTATISIRKKGYETKKITITVAANGRYPTIPVTLDETQIQVNGGKSKIEAVVKNNASSGTIRKIVYEYQAVTYHEAQKETETSSQSAVSVDTDWEKQTQTIKFSILDLKPGKSKKAEVNGDFGDADRMELTLKSVKLYSGKALLTYAESGKVSMDWGVKDKTAPVITGWIGKESYHSKDAYMVLYPDQEYDFSRYVKAVDDRDGSVKVEADTSRLNWKKKGTYTIVFTATDKAGNQTKEKAKVQVRTVGKLEKQADTILSGIIRDSWTDQKKAEAIYRYVRKNYTYTNSNDYADWEKSAANGLRSRKGNYYVFYSVSRLLLTRCGIPNMEVKHSGGLGHVWNYVYIKNGWYHFDTTPRQIQAVFCLVTDTQLTIYSNVAGKSHVWNKGLLPKCASKEISKVVWGRLY